MIIVGPTLPEPYHSDVESVWNEIAEEFGTNGISNPIPHFTLYGLDVDSDIDALERALETTLGDWDPFEVRTDGLGIFPGDHVWIPVAKSPRLTSLHQDVVEVARECGTAPTPITNHIGGSRTSRSRSASIASESATSSGSCAPQTTISSESLPSTTSR